MKSETIREDKNKLHCIPWQTCQKIKYKRLKSSCTSRSQSTMKNLIVIVGDRINLSTIWSTRLVLHNNWLLSTSINAVNPVNLRRRCNQSSFFTSVTSMEHLWSSSKVNPISSLYKIKHLDLVFSFSIHLFDDTERLSGSRAGKKVAF